MLTSKGRSEYPIVEELSRRIKANRCKEISSCLARIKGDQQSAKEIREGGGLYLLVDLLGYLNRDVLNRTLSILADACCISDTRERVRSTEIVPKALSLLRNLKIDDVVHCRVCRLIGNLAECRLHAEKLYQAGAIRVLADLLELKMNMQTHLMAVRAVKNMWENCEQSREEILRFGVILRITTLLANSERKVSENDLKYSELAKGCLKAIHVFLSSSNNRCDMQICGTNDDQGIQSILSYAGQNNKLAIKCLHKLSEIPDCRPILGKYGAVDRLISVINSQWNELSWELVRCLCLYCREAVNRARFRGGSGLNVMLNILKKNEYEHYHFMLLNALNLFTYDEESIFIMIKFGLVEVLAMKLRKMVNETRMHKSEEKSVQNSKRSSDSTPARKYLKLTLWSRFSLDYQNEEGRIPAGLCYRICGRDMLEDAEDNYSPVCSENEEEEDVESLKSCKCPSNEEEDVIEERVAMPKITEYMEMSKVDGVLTWFSRLSRLKDPVDRLVDPETIKPLVAYIKIAKSAKASRILTRIVANKAYLIPLVKQGFAFEAQTLYGSEDYTSKLCSLAETGGAFGEMSSILLKGKESDKLIVANSIPFLIKTKPMLRLLLSNYGGLPLIFQVLTDKEHSLYENAIWSICRLADALQIRPERFDGNEESKAEQTEEELQQEVFKEKFIYSEEMLSSPNVIFELDDGTTVEASRRMLCERSDAFMAMLEGNFSESGKKRIKLPNTSKSGLNTLLRAVNGQDFQNDIESILDAVLLADKYLMTEISDTLAQFSISMLNHETYSRVWYWAKVNSCYELKSCCIKSFLTADMTQSERIGAFEGFHRNEHFHEFLEDVKDIINAVLVGR